MEPPICLSQYFMNKQNVRSFNNILKTKLLKSEDVFVFLHHVFDDSSTASEIPVDYANVLSVIKNNLRCHSKQDFKNYFTFTVDSNQDKLTPVGKALVFENCWRILYKAIIPKTFFGSNHNIKIMRKLVQNIIYSMKRQYIMLGQIINKWDLTVHPWKCLSKSTSRNVLYKTLLWILKNILSAIICLNFYCTTCKLDADENKIYFFWKHEWQSYYDKMISNMLFAKVIEKFDTYCLGKKIKMNLSIGERHKLKALKKEIPKLHLILKNNNDYRPIACYKNNLHSSTEKYKIKDRLNFLKTLGGKQENKIEINYNKLYQKWLNLHSPKLYFIRTDLSNAFGSINREKLMNIINEKHLNYQKTEKDINLKKKFAQQYKDILSELRKPILVRAGSTVYEWKEGLVQGYKYSPALSELYYSYMDDVYLSEYLAKSSKSLIKLLIRVVDDYLCITDSKDDAELFLKAISNYRNVNYNKTVVNFPYQNVQFSEEITFLGYKYNTNTLEVSRASNILHGQMCYKITFSNSVINIFKFLENRIGRTGIQINGHIFNLHYNSEKLIWQHIFTTFCLSANKFCTILAILCEEKDMQKYLMVYKKLVTVKLGNTIIQTIGRNKSVDFMFMYCINHLRYLSFKALQLCARQTSKCSGLIPLINDEVAKSNCIFGKWKEHGSRVDASGQIQRQAIKAICTRADLRDIMRNFNTLPCGFECYNYKCLL